MKNNKEVKKIIDIVFFAILVAIMTYYFSRLVFCQTIYAGRSDGYPSDILAYMQEIQGIDSGYPFPYRLFFLIGKFFNLFMPIDYAITVTEVLMNCIAIIVSKYYFEQIIVKMNHENDKWYVHILIDLSVTGCFLMAMWWLPRFGSIGLPHKDQVFLGTYSGNPWHNATYIGTRPFAIVAFFSFAAVLEEYENKINIKDLSVFCISLLLTTLAKPSFTFVLVSSAGIIMLYRLIRAKFSNFKNSFLVALSFVPTFIALLFQFFNVFGSGNESSEHGIGFNFFYVWKMFNPHIIEAIFYANVFSLFCILILYKQLKTNTMYRLGLTVFVVSILEAGLLCEKGDRFSHFNFSWGYMHGIFFFSMATLIMLIEKTVAKKNKPVSIVLAWLLFASQIYAGIMYFRGVYRGLDYGTLLPATWLS